MIAILQGSGLVGRQNLSVQARFIARVPIFDIPRTVAAGQAGVNTSDAFTWIIDPDIGVNFSPGIFSTNQHFRGTQWIDTIRFHQNQASLLLDDRLTLDRGLADARPARGFNGAQAAL